MKIAIVNHDFSLGGVQRVAITIADGLAEIEDYSVYLISFSGIDNFYYSVSEKCKIIINPAKRKFSENLKFRLAAKRYKISEKEMLISKIYKNQLRGLISILKDENFDCVILCQSDLTALASKIKTAVPKIKVIGWQHSDYEIYFTNTEYAKLFLDEYVKGLEVADEVVCLAKNYQTKFRRHNKNTVFIYNPVTLDVNKISKLNTLNIIFVGRLVMENKGLDLLLDVIEQAPQNWNWILAGDGKDRNQLESLILKKQLTSKIKLVGALNKDNLIKHYESGSVFVSTSRWEGFGLSIIEAMSFGLPIVAFDIPGVREALDDGRCGILIEKYDILLFYQAVERLMDDYELRMHYQNLSLERVKCFTLKKILPEWRKIIE